MTDCHDELMRDLLPDYALGALAAEDATRVGSHLAVCASCRAELALLAQVRAGLALAAPRIDVAAIVSALPAPPTAAPRALGIVRAPLRRHLWQYATAAGLLLVAGGGLFWRSSVTETGVRVADSSYVRLATPSESTVSPAAGAAGDGITFGGGLSDLTLEELQTLLGQMDSVRSLPSTDPESVTPVIAMNEGGKTL
ncbi:MAG TPA: zf-HC2 domain-containing protein [Gemmatimonadaceae bacterium]|jgi:anti-sigma factor RsiW